MGTGLPSPAPPRRLLCLSAWGSMFASVIVVWPRECLLAFVLLWALGSGYPLAKEIGGVKDHEVGVTAVCLGAWRNQGTKQEKKIQKCGQSVDRWIYDFKGSFALQKGRFVSFKQILKRSITKPLEVLEGSDLTSS